MIALHVHPDYWPMASDFIPERFLAAHGDPLHPVRNAWRPFELGSTRCPGEELTMMEIRVALALTVRELDLDINYELWDQVIGRSGTAHATVDGERAYRSGDDGLGLFKDDMPVRVRLRQHKPMTISADQHC
jgi:hypothetical protein